MKVDEIKTSIVLIEKKLSNAKAFDSIVNDLNIQDIDLVQLPVMPKQTKKQKRDNREICMHLYSSYRRKTQYKKISDISETWHYIDYSKLNSDHKLMETYFNIKICGLSESAIKAIKGNSNFKDLDTLLSNHKLKVSEIKQQLKSKISIKNSIINFLNNMKVTDKLINEYLNKHNDLSKVTINQLPQFVIDKIEDLTEVKEFQKLVNKFENHVDKNYKLLNEYRISKDIEKDLETYFNAKQKELKNG